MCKAEREWEREIENRGRQEGLSQGIEQGLSQGIKQGLSQGIEQGLSQGAISKTKQMYTKLINKGKSIKEIADLFDITAEEVQSALNYQM